MASRKREEAKMNKRRELMWELHDTLARKLLEQLKDPDSRVRAGVYLVVHHFLKDNGILITKKEPDLMKHLSDMVDGVEFDFQ